MSTVDIFRKDKHAHLVYMLREEENRVRRTQHAALEQEQAERLRWQERAEAQEARAEEQQARAEAQQARADQLAQELRLLRAQLAGRPADQG
jgi:prolyl-tRNA synthetase